jgi:hypothetical protein
MKSILLITIIMGLVSCSSTKKVNRLFSVACPVKDKSFSTEQVKDLPNPVKRYFNYALEEEQPYLSYLRLHHTGTFKTGINKDWIDIEGEQYFTANPPGFVWIGHTKQFKAHDSYVSNKGNLSVYLFGLLKIVNSTGPTTDQAELLRWLGESVWMPTNLLPNEHIHWSAIDAHKARLTMEWKEHKVTYVVYINDTGQITKLETQRYMNENRLEKWQAILGDYTKVGGMCVPSIVDAIWLLEEGRHHYAHFHIQKFEYDTPKRFEL